MRARSPLSLLGAALTAAGFASACHTTYTVEDIHELEREQEERIEDAEVRSEETSILGGENMDALRHEVEEVERESER